MKSLFEQMGGTYRNENGYLITNVGLPAEEDEPIGVWGQRHLRYIRQYKKVFYTNLLISGKLNGYLANLNEQAENVFFRLVNQMAEKENVTVNLKAIHQMLWVQQMNNVHNRVMEIVNMDFIYV